MTCRVVDLHSYSVFVDCSLHQYWARPNY